MQRKFIGFILVVLSLVFMSGCTTRLGTFSVISTKNIDWSRASEFKRDQKRVKGEDTAHIIVLIPTKLMLSMNEAVDAALQKVPGSIALIDAVMTTSAFYFPYVYGFSSYIIEGSLLIDPSLVAEADSLEGEYMALVPEGEGFKLKVMTEGEYHNLRKSLGLL